MTAFPRSSGRVSSSTETKNASISTCRMEADASAASASGASCLARYCASLVIAARLSLNHCVSAMGNNVLRKLAGAFGGQDARDARQVHGDRNVGPRRLRVEYCAHVLRGIVSEFEDQNAAIAEQAARLVNQALVHFHARWSAEQRGVRFVVADFALQLGGFVARDVWRVADD